MPQPPPTLISGATGVEGTVIDSDTSKPIEGVTVFTDPATAHSVVLTDPAGRFSIDLPVRTWTVAGAIGEDRVTVRGVTTRPDARTKLQMYLRPNCAGGELIRRR